MKATAKCALQALNNISISYPKHSSQYEHPSGFIFIPKEQAHIDVICHYEADIVAPCSGLGAAGELWEQLTPGCSPVHPQDATSCTEMLSI